MNIQKDRYYRIKNTDMLFMCLDDNSSHILLKILKCGTNESSLLSILPFLIGKDTLKIIFKFKKDREFLNSLEEVKVYSSPCIK